MKRFILFFMIAGVAVNGSFAQEREMKVYHFLTVDPKADQYPGINPYLYCAGNPIMYVDPTGMYVNKSFEKIDDDHYKYIGDYRIAKAVESAFEKFPNNTVICAHGNSNFIRWWHFKDSYGLYTTTPDDFKYHCLVDDNYNNILQEIGDSKCSIVILISCETGKGDDNIAKKISAEMPNTIVIAPSEKVWVFPNGDIKVGTGKLVFDKTTGKPVLNEKGEQKETFDKLGLWKMYFNGKERTNFTGLPVFRDKTVEGYINKFKQEDENK